MVTSIDYYSETEKLEKALHGGDVSLERLLELQSRLDHLMHRFGGDESLGADRYGLYQLQAVISYRMGDYTKAKRFIDYAVKLNGGSFPVAEELQKRLMAIEFEPKSETVWWWLIFAPPASLLLVALLQMMVHFVLNGSGAGAAPSTNLAGTFINIFSILMGIGGGLLFLFLPLWIIELVSVRQFNAGHGLGKPLVRRNGILIAVFLGVWYWSYTYKTDKGKFWLNFGLDCITVGYWGLVAWIWAIIHASQRPDAYYELYPYYKKPM